MYFHDIGCEGSNFRLFGYPTGLVIDKYNQLMVCSVNNGRLQFFTLRGKLLGTMWDKYFNNGSPRYVAISNNDSNLLVADLDNVHIFH